MRPQHPARSGQYVLGALQPRPPLTWVSILAPVWLGSMSPRGHQLSAPWAAGHPELQDVSALSLTWTRVTSTCYRREVRGQEEKAWEMAEVFLPAEHRGPPLGEQTPRSQG